MDEQRKTSTPIYRHTIADEKKKERFRRYKYKQVLTSFALMLALTLFAFYAIASEEIGSAFAIPFILVLATVQVLLQLAYFMHLNEKDKGYPIIFMFAGFFVGMITIVALVHLNFI